MHIMEGFLDPIWCVVWFILAIPFVVLGAKKIIELMRDHPEHKMTIALSGAFIFLLSSLKLPSVTGSSSHPTGTGFSAVLYGVCVTSFLATIVLIFRHFCSHTGDSPRSEPTSSPWELSDPSSEHSSGCSSGRPRPASP